MGAALEEPEAQETPIADPAKTSSEASQVKRPEPSSLMLGTDGSFTLGEYRSSVADDEMEVLLELKESTPERVAGDVHSEHFPAEAGSALLQLTEGGEGFRFTNGRFGERGGEHKWIRCSSKCEGTGYGGYGWCYIAGEAKAWGGCLSPGADPMSEAPPRLYTRNRISDSVTPRQHMYCKEKMWVQQDEKNRVPQCGDCESKYFLVPSQHVESKMVGTCFAISKYGPWNTAIKKAKEDGSSSPIHCSMFTNGKGMQTPYFGNKQKDEWNSDPTKSPFNPRGFVCTSGTSVQDHYSDGSLEKGFRQMRVFKATVARFVTCYTASEDAGPLRCTKQKRLGQCRSFFMRNAAFDSRVAHVPSPKSVHNWEDATKEWDQQALKLGQGFLEPDKKTDQGEQLGLGDCDAAWQERLIALM